MQLALIAVGGFFVVFALLMLFVYASSIVSRDPIQGDSSADHELALSAARARRREAGLREDPAPVGVLPTLRAEQLRDPSIGVDQARAEVRDRIHRYNTREVRK